jgi:ATPase subunit of ABC transporter with duplicated ATPase domains
MLKLDRITKSFGSRVVFRRLNLVAPPARKIGIIGPPGSGKTTLLRIILGLEGYEDGRVSITSGTWFGYLPQQPVDPAEYTFSDVLETARDDAQTLKAWSSQRNDEQERPPTRPTVRRRSTRWTTQDDEAADDGEEELLVGLDLQDLAPGARLSTLSPGVQKSVWLASLLISNPDVLVLDDPMTHLGVSVIERLDGFLEAYRGNLLIATDDRTTLDRVVDTLWEVDPEHATVRSHNGNYSTYLAHKASGSGGVLKSLTWGASFS